MHSINILELLETQCDELTFLKKIEQILIKYVTARQLLLIHVVEFACFVCFSLCLYKNK